MKLKSNLLILLLISQNAYSQFKIPDVIGAITNPFGVAGWAGSQVAQQIAPNSGASQLLNPTTTIIRNLPSSFEQTKQLAQQALRSTNWRNLTVFTHPWFIQALTAAKSAKQMGLLKDDDCFRLAEEIANGFSEYAIAETGSPIASNEITRFVSTFGNQVCENSSVGQLQVDPSQIQEIRIPSSGQPTVKIEGNTYQYNQVYSEAPRQFITCTDEVNGIYNLTGYTDGRFFTTLPNGQSALLGVIWKDPTGRFAFFIKRNDSPVWYSVDWQGTVRGPSPNGMQIITWGHCSTQ
ncbi:hypothetical protein [Flavihumibacter petaseus]|uniref:Uncharacterized protein n=1 Tax=Flavihumibacter petaseus NBRC 106054 TaxID=1220578 RepID=A0A0E9MXH4_9BACT|nr:hypothetical protein [Flavihumibacter petaseus]GAO42314.1 hypothetical protein FPE01S_01_13280 [Flavihumibacter petaseus NBRC 106054]